MEEIKMNGSCNSCDYTERLSQFKRGKDLVYGKHVIESYKYYDLIIGDHVNEDRLVYLYALFLYNLKALVNAKKFKVNYLQPHQMIYATKGVFWDWSSKDEFNEMLNCTIDNHGFYFPIFTLPKGVPHNQIEIPKDSIMKNLYNAYNGNHRIDIAQYIEVYSGFDVEKYLTSIFGNSRLVTIEIPPFCEKSCTGFKYSTIKYDVAGPVNISEDQKFDKPIKLFHLNRCSDEMKIDIMEYEKECWDIPLCTGVDVVEVLDYQFAFRILQEFQNVLEYPLTFMYHTYGCLPERIVNTMRIVNDPNRWENFITPASKDKCPFMVYPYPICVVDSLIRDNCDLQLCCLLCDHPCNDKCKFCR